MVERDEFAQWVPYIDAIVNASNDELLTSLADQIGLNLGAQDEETQKRLARAWLDGHLSDLKMKICQSGVISIVRSSGEKDLVTIAAAIADVIVGSMNKPAAATV